MITATTKNRLHENFREYKGLYTDDMTFAEYVETSAENDPRFFKFLFDNAENIEHDFDISLTDEQRAEYEEYLSSLKAEEQPEKKSALLTLNGNILIEQDGRYMFIKPDFTFLRLSTQSEYDYLKSVCLPIETSIPRIEVPPLLAAVKALIEQLQALEPALVTELELDDENNFFEIRESDEFQTELGRKIYNELLNQFNSRKRVYESSEPALRDAIIELPDRKYIDGSYYHNGTRIYTVDELMLDDTNNFSFV